MTGFAVRVISLRAELQRRLAQLESANADLRVSRARASEAEHDERQRIARELHDSLQNSLLGVAIQAQVLQMELVSSPAEEQAATVTDLAYTTLEELGEIVEGFSTRRVSERGLAAATQAAMDLHSLRGPVSVDPGKADVNLQNLVCLWIKEALSNVSKHAGSEAVEVVVTPGSGHLDVSVRDHGSWGEAGPRRVPPSLQVRALLADGLASVEEPPGVGTLVRAVFPLLAD